MPEFSESSKTETESVQKDSCKNTSHLSDLFEGILGSSPKSFDSHVSHSTASKFETEPDLTSLIPSSRTQKAPCLDEDEWDTFVDAPQIDEGASNVKTEESRTTEWKELQSEEAKQPQMMVEASNSQPDVMQIAEWQKFQKPELNELKTDAGVLSMEPEVVHTGEWREMQSEQTEADIFSGEWLNQLRSAHEINISHDHVPETKEEIAESESEWGAFAEVTNEETINDMDPFQNLLPSVLKREEFKQNHAVSVDRNAGILLTQKAQNSPDFLQDTNHTFRDPKRVSLSEDDDEWGGFQG